MTKFKLPSIGEAATLFVKYWGVLGIMYGVITWFHSKNDKIESAVTQKQLIEIVTEFNERLSGVSEQLEITIANQEVSNLNTIQINDNFVTVKEEFAAHIRKSKDIPVDQRLDDILNVVQGIKTDLQQLSIRPDVKIKIEKNDKK